MAENFIYAAFASANTAKFREKSIELGESLSKTLSGKNFVRMLLSLCVTHIANKPINCVKFTQTCNQQFHQWIRIERQKLDSSLLSIKKVFRLV